jgi:hypothetical protein
MGKSGTETRCCAITGATSTVDESEQNLWSAQQITINMDGTSMRAYYCPRAGLRAIVHVYPFIWRFLIFHLRRLFI